MITFKIQTPRAVINEPKYVQEMYIREFQRIEAHTGDVIAAKRAADRLIVQLHSRGKMTSMQKNITQLIEESMSVSIMAQVSEMSTYECLPLGMLDSIKVKDPHPFLAVFDIGGEGPSTGNANNKRERKIWSFSAIKELARKIKDNAAGIIHGHNELNRDSKPKFGRVIHAFTKMISNSLHAIAVAHITDARMIEKIKNGQLDICSIEGNVLLARDNPGGSWFVKRIEKITNLALESSAVTNPGFSGAGILATIQELNNTRN